MYLILTLSGGVIIILRQQELYDSQLKEINH